MNSDNLMQIFDWSVTRHAWSIILAIENASHVDILKLCVLYNKKIFCVNFCVFLGVFRFWSVEKKWIGRHIFFFTLIDCQQTHLALHMRFIKIKVNIWWESDFQFDYFPSLPLYLKSPTELPPCDLFRRNKTCFWGKFHGKFPFSLEKTDKKHVLCGVLELTAYL